MLVSPSILRMTWAVAEEALPHDLVALSDAILVKLLLQRVSQKILLNGEEVRALDDYLTANVSLIRDIAESRLIQEIA